MKKYQAIPTTAIKGRIFIGAVKVITLAIADWIAAMIIIAFRCRMALITIINKLTALLGGGFAPKLYGAEAFTFASSVEPRILSLD